jgi:ABC-2 type transport system ATP-binding protein
MTTTAIETEGLKRYFEPDIRAVDGVDLNVKEGQIFAYLGVNGSGKTTTVRVLTTLLKPTAGRAQVGGLDVTRRPAEVRGRIGVALQDAALDDLQTGRELLTLQARLYGVRPADQRARVSELMDIVDLADAAERPVKTYSGGMKRRLDLAASLVHRPKIVFLDEPTTGLDPISRESIWQYTSRLNRDEGVTFFLTTQYLEEADRLADDIAIMSRGRIIARGSPAELKAEIGTDVLKIGIEGGPPELARAEASLRSFPGLEGLKHEGDHLVMHLKEGSAAVARVVLQLNDGNFRIGEIRLTHPTLDEVFLRAAGEDAAAEAGGERA